MSQAGDLYLGLPGQEIKLTPKGRRLSVGDIEIAREGETASGRLVTEIIATKKLFRINYAEIAEQDLNELESLYNLKRTLRFIKYSATGVSSSYDVRLRPFNRDRITHLQNGVWGNIQLELREI